MTRPVRSRNRRLVAAATVALLAAATAAAPYAPAGAAAGGSGFRSVIRYTEYGIPHIVAADFRGLGYGYGYAVAKDNICALADGYLTVDGQRSRFHDSRQPIDSGFGRASATVNSDLYFQDIKDRQVVERLVRQPAPLGPTREVAEMVRGYAAGYNRYLRDTGVANIADPACRGAGWVRPITELDVYRYVYGFTVSAGSGSVIDGLVSAQPPAPGGTATPASAPAAAGPGSIWAGQARNDLGSNGIAIGSAGTAGAARSVLLGNPHYPWQGIRRFWQSQLTIPGRFDVSGAGLLGFPAVMIGHNRDVAWTHTVAVPATFGLFELPVDPTDPTRYLVDGVAEPMTSRQVTVQVRQADGSLAPVTRTLWSTRLGPVLSGVPGRPLPWGATVHTFRDANAGNLRALNTWFGLGTARSTGDVDRTLSRTQGIPWLNTLATDRGGRAYFGDIQVVPHVTDEHFAACATALGRQIFPVNGIPILDGGRSACAWGTDADAVQEGLFGPARLPRLTRSDYVTNANDSAWLTHPDAPLTGFPAVLGPAGTARSARTQQSIVAVQRRLDGTDGLPGRGFTADTLRQVLFADQSRVAELTVDDAVAMCTSFPDGAAAGTAGPVDVSAACPVLAGWDRSYSLDSRGSLLFARFVQRLGATAVPGGPWAVPFDAADPVNTPRGLATGKAEVRRVFADAVAELVAAGIPVDAPLADHQSVTRNGDRLPVHGAPHALGVLNVITPTWQAGAGNVEVVHGSSFVQVVEFPAAGGPRAATLLTYAQSSDPTSAHFADQTALFSAGRWVPARFSEREIAASPVLRLKTLSE
ncbi:penicillin acylase family protein [Plantactinospora endophytica]|uniref:Penicillin amidase n=1 Tax=Plantactinospora endophytica TaxID=673535 RepID=A0ABQ4E6K8_9ACTN|nr:penicillin acylase family protein [Plantactinospora endophytica]GIG90337.1 penicillin amidase [Plantactinospora endophytica]